MSQSTVNQTVKEGRTVRLVRAPGNHLPGKMVITENGEMTTYRITRMESQIGGQAWRVEKVEFSYDPLPDGSLTMAIAATYDVLLNGSKSTCDCPWGTYGAQKRPCRHLASLAQLIAEGKLS